MHSLIADTNIHTHTRTHPFSHSISYWAPCECFHFAFTAISSHNKSILYHCRKQTQPEWWRRKRRITIIFILSLTAIPGIIFFIYLFFIAIILIYMVLAIQCALFFFRFILNFFQRQGNNFVRFHVKQFNFLFIIDSNVNSRSVVLRYEHFKFPQLQITSLWCHLKTVPNSTLNVWFYY